MTTNLAYRKGGYMSRNEIEVSHFCPKVNRAVNFKVLTGDPLECPECRDILSPTVIYANPDKINKFSAKGASASEGRVL